MHLPDTSTCLSDGKFKKEETEVKLFPAKSNSLGASVAVFRYNERMGS